MELWPCAIKMLHMDWYYWSTVLPIKTTVGPVRGKTETCTGSNSVLNQVVVLHGIHATGTKYCYTVILTDTFCVIIVNINIKLIR